MATTKNITMKQFNGTDYDTLYPKTKVEQIENLTPSSIGAVSKTGDTMTGTLTIKAVIAETKLKSTNDETRSARTVMYENGTSVHLENHKNATNYRGIAVSPETNDITHALSLVQMLNGTWSSYDILHTGNLSDTLSGLKVARSQSGSYVGTGTYGPSNPCSITFSFKPKIVIFPNNTVHNARGKSMIAVDSLTTSYQDVDGTLGYKVHAKFDTTTNTLYWYSSENEAHQLNTGGATYYWVAIG